MGPAFDDIPETFGKGRNDDIHRNFGNVTAAEDCDLHSSCKFEFW